MQSAAFLRNQAFRDVDRLRRNFAAYRLFGLLSGRPWVRIPPGVPKIRKPFMGFRIFVILRGIRTHGRRPGANDANVSPVGSAEGK